ncbi:hypothetical protein GCM10010990_35000 [Croceicoccus mobilis]|uniref:Integrase n=2 Tax=Croceicoccus mobilis TaxID=1703339 RepID=A0A916Z9W3_9SPHN|nr:site-specific integrase [Croceicoccus mobilis]GGD82044.1 hypothetical protein GCM10010990_35000 [Croceicoccus mobilis]
MPSELMSTSNALAEQLRAEIEAARKTLAASHASSTLKAYATDWIDFCHFCEARQLSALPSSPDIVVLYLSNQKESGKAPSTIERRMAAINYHHKENGHRTPAADDIVGIIPRMLRGIKNETKRKIDKKAPADAGILLQMLETIQGEDLRAIRNRAILALGMASALRRSELVAIDVSNLHFTDKGLVIDITSSKTDQEGSGQSVAVPEGTNIKPVAAMRAWLDAAGIADGYAFRRLTRSGRLTEHPMNDRSVARLVKASAAAANLDPARYSAHSLRAGFLTEAAANRASPFRMMDHARHKSLDTVAGYVRTAEQFDNHAGDDFL